MSRRLTLLVAALAAVACNQTGTRPPPSLSEPIMVADAPVGQVVPDRPIDMNAPALAVGFDGTNYLVVWTQPTTLGDDIYAARVSGSGQLLDPQGFVISAATGDQQAPVVAFDGTNWLVAWQDHRAGQYMNVYVARVSSAGQVLDPSGIPIAPQAPYHQLDPALAFDGTNYLVVWADHRAQNNYDIYGARVSPAGVVLDPGGFAVSTNSSQQTTPSVTFDGTNYLVVWQDQRSDAGDIYGARVTPAGVVLEANAFAISKAPGTQSAPVAVFDGTDSLVAWQDLRGGIDTDIYAARVSPAGAVLDASGIAVAALGGNQRSPAVAFDGADVLVVWEDGRSGTQYDVYGARIDPTGAVLEPAGFKFASATAGQFVALASDKAGRGLVAYDAVDATGAWRLRARTFSDFAKVTVTKAGKGGGNVASAPAGIDCGATCTAQFDTPTSVTFTATPDDSSVFGGWSGDCAGTPVDSACTVTVDAAKSVVATFLPLYPVTVSLAGATGTVTSSPAGISCGSTCSSRWVEGTSVLLTPAGTPGASVFNGWSGDCSGAGACTVTLDGPKAATASFVPASTLTLVPSGTGGGTLSSQWGTCATGSICPVDVPTGKTVTITAAPDSGSVLKYWSGCPGATGSTCTITMTSAAYVTARFEPRSFPLTASTTGTGIGTVTGPPGMNCTTGSTAGCTVNVDNLSQTTGYATVTLKATADSTTSVFKQWYGCTPLPTDPEQCTIGVNDARTVTAKFEPKTFTLAVSPTGAAGTISGSFGSSILSCTTGPSGICSMAVDNPPDTYAYNTVTLAVSPGDGAVFKAWGGGCAAVPGSPRTCTISVGTPRTVTAKLEPSSFSLTASTFGTGSGTISGAGLTCSTGSTAGCSANVANPPDTTDYQTVVLKAQPTDASSVFKGWSGCTALQGDPTSCSITVMSARSVSARFEAATFPLTASTTGSGVGTISGAGLACTTGAPDGCSAAVANLANTTDYPTITLQAIPASGSVFKSWTGCFAVAGHPDTCTVMVSSAKAVSAKFEPSTFPLTGTFMGAGSGTINLPGGFACTPGSSSCTASIDNPANSVSYNTVTVTAQPDASSIFTGWYGCTPVPGTPTACTVQVSSAQSVRATFDPSTYPLSAGFSGAGGGTISGAGLSCSTGGVGTCTAPVNNGATVVLTATPDANSIFTGWSGCGQVSGTSCTVTATAAKTVYGIFQPSAYSLAVYFSGSGGGTVAGDQISCTVGSPAGCSEMAANGSTVTLVATPNATSIFKSWSGCTSVTAANACNVTMTGAKYVYATFQPSTYSLSVYPSGSGFGTVSGDQISCTAGSTAGCSETAANGATVVLTATPTDASSVFTGWGGCPAASGNTCTVPMTTVRTVYAYFQPSAYALNVSLGGTGTGGVTGGLVLQCTNASTAGCTVSEPYGTNVTLSATADPGSAFTGWSGYCTNTTGACVVPMTAIRYVRANFALTP